MVGSELDIRALPRDDASRGRILVEAWRAATGGVLGARHRTALQALVASTDGSRRLDLPGGQAIREYATLRALGVAQSSLRAVVIEQSFWIGVAGLVITGVLTWLIQMAAHYAYVAIRFPHWSLALTGALTLIIAIGSGLLALRALGRADPAALLR